MKKLFNARMENIQECYLKEKTDIRAKVKLMFVIAFFVRIILDWDIKSADLL